MGCVRQSVINFSAQKLGADEPKQEQDKSQMAPNNYMDGTTPYPIPRT